MKNILILIIAIASISATSCKKCMTCSQICYKCTPSNNNGIDTLCGGGFVTTQALLDQVQAQESRGYTCTQYNSGKSYQYCDGNSSLTTYLEGTGLTCQ